MDVACPVDDMKDHGLFSFGGDGVKVGRTMVYGTVLRGEIEEVRVAKAVKTLTGQAFDGIITACSIWSKLGCIANAKKDYRTVQKIHTVPKE